MMALFHCVSARSFRPLWTLEALGLPYELKMLPFPPRVLKRDYLDINPLGTVPLFIDGKVRMTESAAICQYLCATHGATHGPTPLQVDAHEEDFGAYLNYLHTGEATLTFPQTLVLRYSRFEPEERRMPRGANDYAKWFLARLKKLEPVLEQRSYLCANRFTAADISVGYALMLAEMIDLAPAFTPAVAACWERLKQEPSYVRALKAEHEAAVAQGVVADFNEDGKPDVFVACHGYDAPPFPGEKNVVVLSQPNGTYLRQDASPDVGFYHGASAADLNGDGFIDVVVTDNFDQDRAIVLLNDETGKFTPETPTRMPVAALGNGGYFSVDLVLGGHEFDGAPTVIFLNPGTNNFSAVGATVVPPVANEGVVLDFTVTGSGASRALWVVRTSGGDGTFYQSKVVQKVTYPALASSVVLNQRPARSIAWLIPTVENGVTGVGSDDAQDNVSFTPSD